MFWLSHHHPDEWDRCYLVGKVRLCARCLGVYPTLVVAVLVQLILRAPLEHGGDVAFVLGLTAPATVDWAFGRFRPHALTNPWRTFTGVALGLALGRSLFIHLQRPFPVVLLLQMGLVTAAAVPVILATYRRSRRG
jgi:uncharacterized membrane protein